MKNIDFLPNRYREETSIRKSQLWRITIILLFGAGLGATAAGQYAQQQQVNTYLKSIELQYLAAQEKSVLLKRLQNQLSENHSTAQLYTYLKHPWPRTQILTAVFRPLPEPITISALKVTREDLLPNKNTRIYDLKLQSEKDDRLSQLLPPQRDLTRLRNEMEAFHYAVQITGYTDHAGTIHQYLGKLEEEYLFEKAELASLESSASEDVRGGLRFSLSLVIRPGYGQKNGPDITGGNLAVNQAQEIGVQNQ